MNDRAVIPPPADAPKCPQCGTPLPTGALAGLCPACLLAQGAAADTVTEGKQPPFNPPPVAELAPLFPQLEILELIGKGGMGAVYKARQKQLDRLVALKILPPGIGDDPAFAERFVREAKALAKLNHPGIVTLYEFGNVGQASRLSQTSEKAPAGRAPQGGPPEKNETGATPVLLFYFLMEFVDGVNLRQLLHAGRISPREALAIVPQICDALQFAHDQGIVHRDIKPENILLDRRGRVKVADFGLAKIVGTDAPLTPSLSPSDGERVAKPGEGTPALTDAGKVMGTPNYMAPEQVSHPADVDHRADIYALGVVFYQMLTGELPGKPLAAPSTKVQIDVRLDEVVLRALEKKPERRYQQVSEVKTCVETIAATPPGSSRREEAHSESGSANQSAAMQEAQSRVKAPAIGLLVAGIIDLAAVFFLLVEFVAVLLSYQTLSAGATTHPPGISSRLLFFLPLCGALLAAGVVILFGAFKMQRLKSYGLSVAASILAMITPPGLLVGLPFGIWALIVLSRREIKAAFEAASRKPTIESAATAPHFSRTAIIGACCLALTVLAVAGALLAASQSIVLALQTPNLPRPLPQQVLDQGRAIFLVAMLSQVFGAICALAGTTLGWIAISQIRRSNGKIRGLGLATFDGLLLPLLALIAVLWLVWFSLLDWGFPLLQMLRIRKPSLVFSLLVWLPWFASSLWLCVRAAKQVWCAVNKPLPDFAPGGRGQLAQTETESPQGNQGKDRFWRRFAVTVAVVVLALILIPVGAILVAMLGYEGSRATDQSQQVRPSVAAHTNGSPNAGEDFSLRAVKDVSATTAREGDIGVHLNSVGTVESSNSVTFAIPDSYCQDVIRRFNAHQALTVEAYNPQRERFGHGLLAWVDNRIDPTTATMKCRASLIPEGENLMVPGLFLNLRLLLEVKHGVTLVPADAVLRDAQGAFVWAIKPDQTVSRRQVQRGSEDGTKVEIQSRLSPGELVVVGPANNDLHEGQKIRYKLVQTNPAASTHNPASGLTLSDVANPVFEVTLNDAGDYRAATLLDLDSGRLTGLPVERLPAAELVEWLINSHVDLYAGFEDNRWLLVTPLGNELKLSALTGKTWENITLGEIEQALSAEPANLETRQDDGFMKSYLLAPNAEPPLTFAFQTGSGNSGQMQIVGFNQNPRGLKIRYKLIQPPQSQAAGSTNSQKPARFTFAVELIVPTGATDKRFLNLDSGDLLGALVTNQPMVEIRRDVGGGLSVAFHHQHALLIKSEEGRQFWESTSPDDLMDRYRRQGFALLPFERNFVFPIQKKDLPMTFELPGAGILQVQEILDGDPPSVKLRYKQVQTAPPPPAVAPTASFGPIVETVLPFGAACLNHLLQFRTGKIFRFGHGPATTKAEYEADRKRADDDGGVDVWISRLEEGLQFIGKGSIFTQEHSPNWNSTTAETVLEQLKRASWTRGVVEPKTKDFPVTYLFRTARGECGIVQLLDVVEDERGYRGTPGKGYGLKLRYKLVQAEKPSAASRPDNTASLNAATVKRETTQRADTWVQRNKPPAGRFDHLAVWTGSEMLIWGGHGGGYFANGGRYHPAPGSWAELPGTGAPPERFRHTAVWTGKEMIVWGGWNGSRVLNDGGRFDAEKNRWTDIPTAGAPEPRSWHTAVWTGREMIVWGGSGNGNAPLHTGGRYDPANNRWTEASLSSGLEGRYQHAAVWTGKEMLVWGGYTGSRVGDTNSLLADGGAYDPANNRWTVMPAASAPTPRHSHTAVWTGKEMIVWGGFGGGYLNSGGRYDPARRTWTQMTTNGAPAGRHLHTAVWTGSEMIVWGGKHDDQILNDGARFDPVSDRWTPLPKADGMAARYAHTAVWTENEMIIWGGCDNRGVLNDTWSYAPGKTDLIQDK